jgi:hypothetical protein
MDIVVTGKHADLDGMIPGATLTVALAAGAAGKVPMTVTIARPGQSVARAVVPVASASLAALTAGDLGEITPTAHDPATVTPSGDAGTDYAAVLVEITTSGGRNAGAFRVSLDDGETWGTPATIPANGIAADVESSGITVTFADAAFVDGDVYEFSVASDVYSAVTETPITPPEIVLSGVPAADYDDVQIEITTTGAVGAGAFRYTLDGGDNWSDPDTIPNSGYAVLGASGIIVNFPAGLYADGATYAFTATAA